MSQNRDEKMSEATAPDTPELAEAFRKAYADTMRSAAQLLNMWRTNLPANNAAKLDDFESKGCSLGALISLSPNRSHMTIRAVIQDVQGNFRTLDTIDLASLCNQNRPS